MHWARAAAVCGSWIVTLVGGACVAQLDEIRSFDDGRAVAGVCGDGACAPGENGCDCPADCDAEMPTACLRADTSCRYDSFDCNPALDDVPGQLAALRGHGAALGFHRGLMSDPTWSHHFQSIQRVPGARSNYLLLTRSTPRSSDADLEVVHLASRSDDGGRLRSNRLGVRRATGDTAPPLVDRVVVDVDVSTAHTHAGGTQLMGKVLAVPLEDALPGSHVELFDVSDPLRPRSLGLVEHVTPDHAHLPAGTASLARLADGRTLLVVGRRGCGKLDFYLSTGFDLRATGWTFLDTWAQSELRTLIGDAVFAAYQNLQLIAGQDRRLYLVGMDHRGLVRGSDWVDLFVVDNASFAAGATEVAITKIGKRRLDCVRDGRQCNLDAGGGTYVDPEGKLILYGVEHDNDGPSATGDPSDGSVKLMEFSAPYASDACADDPGRAFVELYEHHDFTGRSIILDHVDRDLEDSERLGTIDDFEDRASSVRWCMPPGVRLRLYQHKAPCGGASVDLTGRGERDLEAAGLGDHASCARWLTD